ncbi:hypothetical protein D5086_027485 [Populus alba]|uniref:Uncharacterized protein n=1 Tax=Populus alba TaxID=43335 RepID=A0ACC4AVM0_POPAL
MFESGGVAIGLCVTHRVADAYTVFTFVRTWATACKLGVGEVIRAPSFQLPSFFPSRDTISSPNRFIGRNHQKIVVMKRFVFTGAALSKLKAVVSAGVKGSHQPTRVEVVTAVIWKTLTMVAQAKHADDETRVQLHDFVDRVYNGIKNMVSDCARVSSDDELFVMAEKIRIETIKAFTRSEMDLYMFNSWCRMPVYQADFGWGKPGWVSGLVLTTYLRIALRAWILSDHVPEETTQGN